MKPLTKPMKGWYFTLGRVLFHFNFAKTFTWATDNSYSERDTFYIKASKLEREIEGSGTFKVYTFIFFPFKIYIGMKNGYPLGR